MFYTADILVYIHPVVCVFLGKGFFVITRIGVTQIVPAGAHKGVHGICLPACRTAADRTGGIHKLFHIF